MRHVDVASSRRRVPALWRCLSLATAITLSLSACTNPSTNALATKEPLKPAPDLAGAATPGVTVYRSPDLAKYQVGKPTYIIPPATVYRGTGAYYADLSPDQADSVAATLTKDVRTEIARRFKVVDTPGPGVFTIQIILVKIVPPRPAYTESGPFTIPELAVGNPNAAAMTAGTLTVAGKFVDSTTGTLLVEFSAPVSPQVMDLPPPGSPAHALDFADTASQQFASDLVRAIARGREISAKAPQK